MRTYSRKLQGTDIQLVVGGNERNCRASNDECSELHGKESPIRKFVLEGRRLPPMNSVYDPRSKRRKAYIANGVLNVHAAVLNPRAQTLSGTSAEGGAGDEGHGGC